MLISTTYTYIYVKCCCCFLQLISILVLYCSIELHSIGPSKIQRLLYHSLDRVFEMDIHSFFTYTAKLRDLGIVSKIRQSLKMVFKAPKHTMFCKTKIDSLVLFSNQSNYVIFANSNEWLFPKPDTIPNILKVWQHSLTNSFHVLP